MAGRPDVVVFDVLLAGWCARLELEPGDVFLPADVIGQTLTEVAEKLLTLR